jgi:hypothetical protein
MGLLKREELMPQQPDPFDLYTFIAGAELERRNPFLLECNCGGVVTIMRGISEVFSKWAWTNISILDSLRLDLT